jgi:hypothetical protein
MACLAAEIILQLTSSGFNHALVLAIGIVVVLVIHLILRLTYFRDVLPEIRKERQGRRAEG